MTDAIEHKLTPIHHVVSFLSFFFITINLLFWLPVLLVAAIVRLVLPFRLVRMAIYRAVEGVYRLAVRVDAWWFRRVLGLEFELEDEQEVLKRLQPNQTPLVICNHQSWFDIFLLQTLIAGHGPILKFVIKAELIWVPVLGWICLALNFPRLKRRGDEQSRAQDLQNVARATLSLGEEPGGLLIFPEGTRFSREKMTAQNSAYKYLLRPKSGGLTVIKNTLPPSTQIIDRGISYTFGDASCWRCMSSAVRKIRVRVDALQLDAVANPTVWLNQRWSAKDAWLAAGKPK